MIKENLKLKADISKKAITESNIPSSLKEDLIDTVDSSLISTNGLNQENKLQAVSESVFNLSRLVSRLTVYQTETMEHLSTMKDISWKQCLVSLKWQVTIIVGILSGMLIFRPELSILVEHIFKLIK